jgi:isoleucyl-tRNA synthetase
MVWNMYDFFTMYAEVDGWETDGELVDPSQELENDLDRWIVSRVHQLSTEVASHMDAYDLPNAMKPILPFIDDASNWYVRRSRKRFWKSEDDADKANAYKTLYYVLLELSNILAPFTPFLAEELYIKLTGKESVHLNDWPKAGHINELLIDEMAHARKVVTAGLSIRARNQLKVRQPLAAAKVSSEVKLSDETIEIIKEELNVKQVTQVPIFDIATGKDGEVMSVELDLNVSPELKLEGLMREVVRQVQDARKKSGLNVDDRINLSIYSDDSEITQSIKQHSDEIMSETLALKLDSETDYSNTFDVKIASAQVTIKLEKA